MLIKKLLPAAITAAMLAGTGLAQAEDEGFTVSGNVALTSDYRFRGISQSDESAAIQGGFDAEFGPGFYVGAWGSSVDFDSNDGYDGSLELDYYGGWTMPIGDTDFSVDIGYIYYDYPGDNGSDGDYQEVYLGGAWKGLSLQVNYSDDYYAGTDDFYYVSAGYSHSFSDHLSLKIEPYAQLIFNVPISMNPNSSFSALNLFEDNYIEEALVNEGTGLNYGLEVSVERTLDRGPMSTPSCMGSPMETCS